MTRVRTNVLFARNHLVTPFLSTQFHTTALRRAEVVNHYEVLGLSPGAAQDEIKKKFYTLSKTHHPDHNPNDPHASERFVKISSAYAVLGTPQKRQTYDRDVLGVHKQQQQAYAGGRRTQPSSTSSSSSPGPFGARPASGLSRRRAQFRGPPPSFYRSGGWGAHGEKRRAAAAGAENDSMRASERNHQEGSGGVGEEKAPPSSAESSFSSSARTEGGMGYGQGQAGFYNDVPHFDQEGHYRTQVQQDRRRRRRRRMDGVEGWEPEEAGGGNTFSMFLLLTGIVMFATAVGMGPWS